MTTANLLSLLKKEMVPALGCTEPIAIAYAAAMVTKHLGSMPERFVVHCSANIIKNVKSVIVPNSGGMKGIGAATIIGALAGNADKKLQVLCEVTQEQIKQVKVLIEKEICDIRLLKTPTILHIVVTGYHEGDEVSVEIKESHTNITNIIKNDKVLFLQEEPNHDQALLANDNFGIKDIIAFARTCDYADIVDVLDSQIDCNSIIAQEGLKNTYGVNAGQMIMLTSDGSVKDRAKAFAASGSDARMNGCDLPVVINSGSGNQGITVSVPVIEYAKELGCSKDELYRALILSNLVALYEKSFIGKLSAYCGVVCAASGAGAGITMLKKGSDEQIEFSITNTLGTLSGIVCDGAKASCATKISTCIDTAICCHELAMQGRVLQSGDGIIKDSLDSTVKMVGRLASQGMCTTDEEILSIMLDN